MDTGPNLAFILHYLFMDVCIVKSLERYRYCLHPAQRTNVLTAQYNKNIIGQRLGNVLAAYYKRLEFAKLGVLRL